MARKDILGQRGEELAVEYLVNGGYTVIDRNWRCAHGEIDIIARHDAEVVFIEVKTRSGVGYGHPLDAVTPVKLARLRRLVGAWCADNEPKAVVRLDVVGVIVEGEHVHIDHVRQVG